MGERLFPADPDIIFSTASDSCLLDEILVSEIKRPFVDLTTTNLEHFKIDINPGHNLSEFYHRSRFTGPNSSGRTLFRTHSKQSDYIWRKAAR